jgi:hypothetical protein
MKCMRIWLALALVALVGPLGARDDDLQSIALREAIENARKKGFGDVEIDNLHGEIATRVQAVLKGGGIPEGPGNFDELTEQARTRALISGKDPDGKSYLRIRLRDGISYSTHEFPQQFVYRAHCYLYPGADGSLDKVVFQFYRINYVGGQYIRDMRRYIHPQPKNQAQAEGKPVGADLQLLDNSNLALEFYEDPSTVKPVWEGPDGVPLGTIAWRAKSQIVLNAKEDPMPYPKQVQVIWNYKRLLRQLDRILQTYQRHAELERNRGIEKVLDYTGSSF